MSYSVSQSAPISTVMVTPAQALADLFFRGAHGVALDEVRTGSPELVWRVAQLVGTGLRADAVAHWNAWPREVAWVDHQAALLALARLPGVDQEELGCSGRRGLRVAADRRQGVAARAGALRVDDAVGARQRLRGRRGRALHRLSLPARRLDALHLES
jgi:hypothetical protein